MEASLPNKNNENVIVCFQIIAYTSDVIYAGIIDGVLDFSNNTGLKHVSKYKMYLNTY